MTAPKTAARTDEAPQLATGPDRRRPVLRRTLAAVMLSVAVVAALLASGWGILSAQASQTAVAFGEAVPQGEAAEVPGGLLRVDGVIPEHMAPMQMGKFSQSGMNMSGMGVDMTPEGQRRFTVEVSLAAGNGSLEYSANDFRLVGEDVARVTPVRSQLGDGMLPAGSETRGALIFQAPADAKDLALSFDGGEPAALELENKGEGRAYGAPSSGGHGH